jgi:tetratricopeptide (TPR) repeat protein
VVAIVLTRFEVFRVSRGIGIAELARESGYHRTHILRMRQGKIDPSREAIAAFVSAVRRIALEEIRAEALFELSVEESGPWRADITEVLARETAAYRRERARVQQLLVSAVRSPQKEWLDALRRLPDGISEAVARGALLEGRNLVPVDVRKAELLFRLAAAVADEAPDIQTEEFRAFLSGRARVERAIALREIGSYHDALTSLAEAEARFAGQPICTVDLGRCWTIRGSILLKTNGLDEAQFWLRLAVNIFSATADERRVALTRQIEGSVLFERGNWDGARHIWLSLLPVFTAARSHPRG